MTEKELKKLSRADLLEMLIEQSTELQELQVRLDRAEAALQRRELTISTAGSIAEASLQLNGVFEAAQAACEQYTDNIRLLSERQESICQRMERESREKAEQQLAEAQQASAALEEETRLRCEEMVRKAQAESQAYWDELSGKLEAFYAEHADLRELLAAIPSKRS